MRENSKVCKNVRKKKVRENRAEEWYKLWKENLDFIKSNQ